MQKYLLIAAGGALGALARYAIESAIGSRMGTRFPYGTLIVNTTACFLIGFTMTLLVERTGISPAWRFLVPIGFIGAYSTFSTWEWEAFSLLQVEAFAATAAYVALSFVLGLAAVWLGAMLAQWIG